GTEWTRRHERTLGLRRSWDFSTSRWSGLMAADAKKREGPVVQAHDQRSLGRVGIIALVGFTIGIVWPRLAGVSLVPEAPVEDEGPLLDEESEDEEPTPTEPEMI